VLGHWYERGPRGELVSRTGVWQDGRLTVAPTSVVGDGNEVDIDDSGRALVALRNAHAGVWQVGGGVTDLGALVGPTGSVAYDISDRGQVAGVFHRRDENRALLWTLPAPVP
jgi:hypothetical protein